MGLGPSRLTYEMPPPPVLKDEDLDLSLEASALQDRIVDQEGYYMCRRVAIREGVLAAGVAMSVMGLAIMTTKRYAGTFISISLASVIQFSANHLSFSMTNTDSTAFCIRSIPDPQIRSIVKWPTVQALLNYSPGVLFLVTSTFVYWLFKEAHNQE